MVTGNRRHRRLVLGFDSLTGHVKIKVPRPSRAKVKVSSREEKGYDRVLRALQSSDRPLTMKEWAYQADMSVTTIHRRIPMMLHQGEILRVPPTGVRKGDRFRAVVGTPEEVKTLNLTESLTPLEILQLLVSFSKKPWEPKAFKSARTLPVGLAQLYGYAVEASYGAKISQSDLDSVRTDMTEFLGDLQNLLKVVASILKTNDLWSEKKFVELLLAGKDPDQIQEFVHRVRELN